MGQAALDKAQEERDSLARAEPKRTEKQTARVIRMLPRAAQVLRERLGTGNLGLRDPRSIIAGRNMLFCLFGGKVPLRPAPAKAGERPYLLARVGVNRAVLLEAAGSAAGCVESGSGGVLCDDPTIVQTARLK
jgi:hypothetical protein